MVLSLEEEYRLGCNPVSIDGKVMSLDNLKKLPAGDLLGKEVVLFGHSLDLRLLAVYCRGCDCKDLLNMNFASKSEIEEACRIMQEVRGAIRKGEVTQHTYWSRAGSKLGMRFEVNLADSSLTSDFWHLLDGSAYHVLEEYVSETFTPIYDDGVDDEPYCFDEILF